MILCRPMILYSQLVERGISVLADVDKCPNPSYLAYAKMNGKSFEEMLKHDTELYPGGCMTGFILFISDMKRKFRKASPESFLYGTLCDHKKFSEFINQWVEQKIA